MRSTARFPAAGRAATLALSLAVLLGGGQFYSHNTHAPSGSITLAKPAARKAQPAKYVIVWPAAREKTKEGA